MCLRAKRNRQLLDPHLPICLKPIILVQMPTRTRARMKMKMTALFLYKVFLLNATPPLPEDLFQKFGPIKSDGIQIKTKKYSALALWSLKRQVLCCS